MFQLGQEKTGDHRNECSCIRNPMWGGSLLNWVELMQPAFFLGGDQQDLTGRTVGKESREPSKVKCPWMYHMIITYSILGFFVLFKDLLSLLRALNFSLRIFCSCQAPMAHACNPSYPGRVAHLQFEAGLGK
jgi:hypothetical protein